MTALDASEPAPATCSPGNEVRASQRRLVVSPVVGVSRRRALALRSWLVTLLVAGQSMRALACVLWLAGCGGGWRAPRTLPPPRLFDPLAYRSLPGPRLAFGTRDGALRSYFHRQGSLVVHVLARSGPNPSFIATFPAHERGIAAWFQPVREDTELYAGTTSEADQLAAGGGLVAIWRDQGRRPLHGVRGTLTSSAKRLSTEIVVLGSSRRMRAYAHGACCEGSARCPEFESESFELDPERNALRIRVKQGGESSLELLLVGTRGTGITLHERQRPLRDGCSFARGAGQPSIELTNGSGIGLEFIALSSDEPVPLAQCGPDIPPSQPAPAP